MKPLLDSTDVKTLTETFALIEEIYEVVATSMRRSQGLRVNQVIAAQVYSLACSIVSQSDDPDDQDEIVDFAVDQLPQLVTQLRKADRYKQAKATGGVQ